MEDQGPTGEKISEYTECYRIAPDGIGYGEGAISVKERLATGELPMQTYQLAQTVITDKKYENRLFKAVESNDDGCSDGRFTLKAVQYLRDKYGAFRELQADEKLRAKVFGGGLVVVASMLRSVGVGSPDMTLLADRSLAARVLRRRHHTFGAHTTEQAHDEACGCGAIDESPAIAANILKYRSGIQDTLTTLYENDYEENAGAAENVFAAYRLLDNKRQPYYAGATGKANMEIIKHEGAVVKELGGDHEEVVIVLNDIEGTTFDQQELAAILKERGARRGVQAFVVDIWRGRQYAELVADESVLHLQHEHERSAEVWSDADYAAVREGYRRTAMADFLMRTLATAATLTAGDLPVVMRRQAA